MTYCGIASGTSSSFTDSSSSSRSGSIAVHHQRLSAQCFTQQQQQQQQQLLPPGVTTISWPGCGVLFFWQLGVMSHLYLVGESWQDVVA
jgi:hypothetical protein